MPEENPLMAEVIHFKQEESAIASELERPTAGPVYTAQLKL
jgi:hypothetical protein